MASFWKGKRSAPAERFSGSTLEEASPMGGGFLATPYPVPPPVSSRDPKLDPGPAYFVRVCGFTFEFWSVDQIEAALQFYRVKVHPSSRMPTWGEHDVTQRWYERVPQHLQANGKRERVVKALVRALRKFGSSLPGDARRGWRIQL